MNTRPASVSKTTASRGRLTCEEEPGLELVSTELATL
jgi:hypothetical protein